MGGIGSIIGKIGAQIYEQDYNHELPSQKIEGGPEISEVAFNAGKIASAALQASMLKEQLEQIFYAGAPPELIDQAKVDEGVKTIQNRLDEEYIWSDVSHGDLEDIQNVFADLNPAEANAVFERLSDKNLNKLTEELNGQIGGFSSDEKKSLFNELAGKLNINNQNRLDSTLQKYGLVGDSEALTNSITTFLVAKGSPQTKVDFVKNMAGIIEGNHAKGIAVAKVIASLKNNSTGLNEALKGLNENQLKSLMESASVEIFDSSSVLGVGGPSVPHTAIYYDAKVLNQMLNAVSTSNDPRLKADVFNAAGEQLKTIEESSNYIGRTVTGTNTAAAQIHDGLTQIIDSDTTGIVKYLQNQDKGVGLASYLQSMIGSSNQDDRSQIRTQITSLLRGNNSSQNQIEYFEQRVLTPQGRNKMDAYNKAAALATSKHIAFKERRPLVEDLGMAYFQNANSIGFYAGAINAASKNIVTDRAKQVDLIKSIFGTTVDKAGGYGFAPILSDNIIDTVVGQMDDNTCDMATALRKLTMPVYEKADPSMGIKKGDLIISDARGAYEGSFNFASETLKK